MAEQDTPAAVTKAKATPSATKGWVRAAGQTLRGIGWVGHWLPGAALALGSCWPAGWPGWVWSGSEGSLARALGWAQSWVADANSPRGQLQTRGAQGSLRHGGQVQQLRWTRPGLDVQLQGLRLQWTDDQLIDALLGRGLQIATRCIWTACR